MRHSASRGLEASSSEFCSRSRRAMACHGGLGIRNGGLRHHSLLVMLLLLSLTVQSCCCFIAIVASSRGRQRHHCIIAVGLALHTRGFRSWRSRSGGPTGSRNSNRCASSVLASLTASSRSCWPRLRRQADTRRLRLVDRACCEKVISNACNASRLLCGDVCTTQSSLARSSLTDPSGCAPARSFSFYY